MISLALKADSDGNWGLLDSSGSGVVHTDTLIYDRFGPSFSDPEFAWHVDAGDTDPRLVSVVAYLSDQSEFTGGQLEMEVSSANEKDENHEKGGKCEAEEKDRDENKTRIVSRSYTRGWAVAFPSKSLRHVVRPVVAGERRSFLLLVGNKRGKVGAGKYICA